MFIYNKSNPGYIVSHTYIYRAKRERIEREIERERDGAGSPLTATIMIHYSVLFKKPYLISLLNPEQLTIFQ
jgi:hypothetical protein